MNLLPSFPLWVTESDSGLSASVSTTFNNDGAEAVNTMKMFIAAAAVPVDEYYGFPMPRGTPFMKSTGANEIEVVTARAGV